MKKFRREVASILIFIVLFPFIAVMNIHKLCIAITNLIDARLPGARWVDQLISATDWIERVLRVG